MLLSFPSYTPCELTVLYLSTPLIRLREQGLCCQTQVPSTSLSTIPYITVFSNHRSPACACFFSSQELCGEVARVLFLFVWTCTRPRRLGSNVELLYALLHEQVFFTICSKCHGNSGWLYVWWKISTAVPRPTAAKRVLHDLMKIQVKQKYQHTDSGVFSILHLDVIAL